MGSINCAQALAVEQELKSSSFSQLSTQLDSIDEAKSKQQQSQLKTLEHLENVINWVKNLGQTLEIENQIQEIISSRQEQIQDLNTIEAQINLRVSVIQNIFNLIESFQNNLIEKSKESLSLLCTNESNLKESKLFQLENLKVQYIQTKIKATQELEQSFKKEQSELQNQLAEKEKMMSFQQKQFDENINRISQLETDRKSLQGEIQNINQNLNKEKNEKESQIMWLTKELESLQQTIKQSNEKNDAQQKKISELEAEKQNYFNEIQTLKSQIQKLQIEQEEIAKRLKEKELENQKLLQINETQIKEKEKKISEIENEKVNFVNQIKILNQKIQESEAEKSKTSQELKQGLAEKEKTWLSFKQLDSDSKIKISQLEAEKVKQQEIQQGIRKEKMTIENELQQLKKDLQSKLEFIKKSGEEYEAKIKEKEIKLQEFENEKINFLSQIQQLNQKIKEYDAEKEKTTQELKQGLAEKEKTWLSFKQLDSDSKIKISQLEAEKTKQQEIEQGIRQEKMTIENELQQLKKDLESKLDFIKKSGEEYEAKIKILEVEKEKLQKESQSQNQISQETKKQLESQIKQLKTSLTESQELYEKFKKEAELKNQTQQEKIQDYEVKLKQGEEMITNLQKDKNSLQESQQIQLNEIQNYKVQLLQYQSKKEELDQIYQGKVKDLQLIKIQQEEILNLKQELKQAKEGKKDKHLIQVEIGIINQINESYENEIKTQKYLAVQQNILVKDILSHYVTEKILPEEEVWKYFDKMLLEKYQQDSIHLNSGEKCDLFVNFIYQNAIKQSEDHTSAKKFLSSLLITLQNMHQQNVEYANVFCRFLQVYHQDPFDRNLSTFLISCNFRFSKAVDQYRLGRIFHETAIHQEILKEEFQEEASEGGYAPLIDVFEITLKIFEVNKEIAGSILFKLIPEHKSEQEFALFFICWRMASMGIKPQTLFDQIAEKNKQIMTAEQFKEAIKQNLEIHLGETQFQSLINHLDTAHSGFINCQVYLNKVQQLTKSFKNKEAWTISKYQFFIAISDEYEKQRINCFYRLRNDFTNFFEKNQGKTDLEQITALCRSIVPETTVNTVQIIYQQAQQICKSQVEGEINADSFAGSAINNNFGTFELDVFDSWRVIKQNDREEEQKKLRKSI